MTTISFSGHETHAGHDHGAFGELMEHLLEKTPLSDKWQEFVCHITVDFIHILFLLILIMTLVYFISGYVNIDKLHHKLEHLKSIPGFILAIAAGVISPFCSCSIIPVLMGLISVGVPASVCLCYLTASSMLNLTALFSLFAVSGPKFFVVYLACALLMTIVSSIIFSLMKLDSGVKSYVGEHHHHHEEKICGHCVWHRLKCALLSSLHVLRQCWIYILLGVTLSGAIMTFLSMETITSIVNENSFLSSTIVSLIGIPIHSDIFSIAPVLLFLLDISFPVALSFTLSTMSISIPSVVILTRSLKAKTVAIYCGVICSLTLLTGWLCVLVF